MVETPMYYKKSVYVNKKFISGSAPFWNIAQLRVLNPLLLSFGKGLLYLSVKD
jgi:hypothetical protein